MCRGRGRSRVMFGVGSRAICEPDGWLVSRSSATKRQKEFYNKTPSHNTGHRTGHGTGARKENRSSVSASSRPARLLRLTVVCPASSGDKENRVLKDNQKIPFLR